MRHYTFIILAAVLLLSACDDKMVYSEYNHTPVGGWEKNEPVSYTIAPIKDDGVYNLSLNLRLSGTYPFRNLHLMVRQTVYPKGYGTDSIPPLPVRNITDMPTCMVTDDRGTMLGSGVTYYQYDIPLRKVNYHSGDSIVLTVSHTMKREILPGIADVGITLSKE